MKAWRYLAPLALFVVLLGFLAKGLDLNPREVPSPLIGKPAPAFTLPLLQRPEQAVSAKDLAGKVWVLNVFASWCTPCLDEHPVLVDFAKRNPTPLVGLNYKDAPKDATAWLARHGNPYATTVADRSGAVGIDYGVYGVPETFVVDKHGVIRFKHVGPITAEIMSKRIEPLIKQLNG
jgi:cytochrome c biogenesis protein CcmG, thiol:disulfide interchange protein DsbE